MSDHYTQVEPLSINIALNRFYRQRSRVFSKDFAKMNLTPLQAGILWGLTEVNGCIQKDMAQSLNISPSSMVSIVNTMVDAGFITRSYSPSDRRVVHLFLTEAGLKMANEVHNLVLAKEEKYMQDLTSDEQEQLRLLLIKGYHSWERHGEA